MHSFATLQAQARRYSRPSRIADQLPLLSELVRDMPEVDLSEHSFLFIQHFLADFPARLQVMLDLGLRPDRTWFLDIPYSTNEAVRQRICDTFEDRVPHRYQDPFGNYCNDQLDRLASLLDTVLQYKGTTPLVVVDDGAYFARYLSSLHKAGSPEARHYRGAFIVEQTTRGHRFLQSVEGQALIGALSLRAVSIARTRTKTMFEAPFIGVAVADSVMAALACRKHEPQRTLVLGFGYVGHATALALRAAFPEATIDVLEVSTQKLELAQSLGFGTHRSLCGTIDGCSYDLIAGCTGHRTFCPTDRTLLADKALLASGSSAAVEFDRCNFVDQADARNDDDFCVLTERTRGLPLHTDITFEHGPDARTFTMVNAGFPVNFESSLGVIPTELIAPTLCLLHSATIEALHTTNPGLTSLSQVMDQKIHAMALSLLSGQP